MSSQWRIDDVVTVDHTMFLAIVQVSTSGRSPPLASLFPHHVFRGEDGDSLTEEAKKLPVFDGV